MPVIEKDTLSQTRRIGVKYGGRVTEVVIHGFTRWDDRPGFYGYIASRTRSGSEVHLSGVNTRSDEDPVLYMGNTALCNGRSMNIYHVSGSTPTCENCLGGGRKVGGRKARP